MPHPKTFEFLPLILVFMTINFKPPLHLLYLFFVSTTDLIVKLKPILLHHFE